MRDCDDRPTIHCFVALPLRPGAFTSPARVSLELAAEMKTKGYMVVGPDPFDVAYWTNGSRRNSG
jgi:hypothetical protein